MVKELLDIYGGMKCIGDIRTATGLDDVRRLVMICGYNDDYPDVFTVYLCTNEHEMGGDLDYIFKTHETSLPYDIMVETDLVGTVYRRQLGERIGGVTTKLLETIPELPTLNNMHTRRTRGPRVCAGIPCRDQRDPRWKWKCDELDVLNQLVAPFWIDFWREHPDW